jgi:hypothetical protein
MTYHQKNVENLYRFIFRGWRFESENRDGVYIINVMRPGYPIAQYRLYLNDQ